LNGDKLNTLEYFVLLSGQHGGLWVSLALKPANGKASKRDDVNRMGSYIAPMAQCDADAAPGEMSTGDLETARLYGTRVTQVARRLVASQAA
jgi:NAD(P)H dehydrogenase (quinone)